MIAFRPRILLSSNPVVKFIGKPNQQQRGLKIIMKIYILMSLLILGACSAPAAKDPAKGTTQEQPQPIPKPPDQPLPPVTQPPRPGFVNLDLLEDTMVLDAQNIDSENQRQRTRYLIACNFTNAGEKTDLVEQGVNKGINLLSTERFLEKVTPIGNENCIYRVDLDAYGISNAEWRKVEQNSVLQFVTKSIRGQQLQFLTQTQRPYLFATDFLVTAFEADALTNKRCDTYCDIVDESQDLATFFQQQGVNPQVEFNNQDALLAAFSDSQIALGKTRMVQVLESQNGYCLSTYDVSLAQPDNALVNPFPIEAANAGGVVRSNKVYKHAAQEHFCTSPNGLYTWRLNGAATGQAEVVAPTDVVNNIQGNSLKIDPAIRIGDCSACHHAEIVIAFKDQAANAIANGVGFSPEEKKLGTTFFKADRMQATVNKINTEYQIALKTLGITATNDPLNDNVMRVFRAEQSADQVAGYTGLDTQTFLLRLRGAPVSATKLGNLLNNGRVSLQILHDAFPKLVEELNLFQDDDL